MQPADFELHFSYKFATPDGNSGVQFRSKVIDPKTDRVGGYQADFDAKGGYDGSIYDEAGVAGGRGTMSNRGERTVWDADNNRSNEKLHAAGDDLKKFINVGDWNDCVVVAKGRHITYAINGHLTTQLIDDSPKALQGRRHRPAAACGLHDGDPVQGRQDQAAGFAEVAGGWWLVVGGWRRKCATAPLPQPPTTNHQPPSVLRPITPAGRVISFQSGAKPMIDVDRICVVIGRTRHKMVMAEIQEAAKRGASLIELRLDFLAKAPDFKRLLADKPCPMVATVRRPEDGGRWSGPEEARRMLLPPGRRRRLRLGRSRNRRRRRHSPLRQGPPHRQLPQHARDAGRPREIHERMCQQDADVVKLAVRAQTADRQPPRSGPDE